VALVAERGTHTSIALAWAALVVLLVHPAAVMAPGFWLSFGAVAWLIWIAFMVQGAWWKKLVVFQCGLVLALMPITLWFFGSASTLAPLVNAVLIPLASVFVPVVLVAVLATLAFPVVGGWLLAHVATWLAAGWAVLAWFAD